MKVCPKRMKGSRAGASGIHRCDQRLSGRTVGVKTATYLHVR